MRRKQLAIIMAIAILAVVVALAVYYMLVMEFAVVIPGVISLEHCPEDDCNVAWVLEGTDGQTYYLAYENWTIICGSDFDYTKWYGQRVLISGIIREYQCQQCPQENGAYKLKVLEIGD